MGGQTQGFGDATFDGAGGDAEDFAAADAIVGANAQPGGEVFGGGEFFGKARAQFGDEDEHRWGLKAWNDGEVDPEDTITFGTRVKAGFVALRRAMGGFGR